MIKGMQRVEESLKKKTKIRRRRKKFRNNYDQLRKVVYATIC